MERTAIYGDFLPLLEQIKDTFAQRIEDYTAEEYQKTGIRIYEHLIARVKSEDPAGVAAGPSGKMLPQGSAPYTAQRSEGAAGQHRHPHHLLVPG